MNSQNNNAITITKKWIAEFIIAYSICPFAENSFRNENIVYEVSFSTDHEDMAYDFVNYMRKLIFMEKDFSNAFIIYPKKWKEFTWFYEFSMLCEEILKEMKLDNDYQIVAFHPFYLFGKERPDSHSHYTNRSPFPMLHILKAEEVKLAIESIGETSTVSQRNIIFLNEMEDEEFQKLYHLIYNKQQHEHE